MGVKKSLIYIITALIIFQDILSSILPKNIIGYLDEIFVVILVIYATLSILRKRVINKKSFIVLILAFCFSAIGIFGCYINSNFIFKDVLMSNFLSIKFILIIISLMNVDITFNIKKEVIKSIEVYSKIVVAIAIFNFLLPNLYRIIFPKAMIMYRLGLPCVTSLFIHPGTYGWFMLLVSLIYYSRYIQLNKKDDLRRFVIYSIFAILSFRVKVILGLVSILIYTLLFLNKNKINIKKVIIITLIVGIVIFLSKDLLKYVYYMYFTKEYGESARMSLNSNSFKILKDYFPIGVGFGKFGSWYARIKYSEHYYFYGMTGIYGLNPEMPFFATDTYWPSIIGETGFIGTSIYILILIYIYMNIKKKFKNVKAIEEKVICIFALLVFIQTLIESSSEAIFNNSPQFVLVSVVIGLALNNTLSKNNKFK